MKKLPSGRLIQLDGQVYPIYLSKMESKTTFPSTVYEKVKDFWSFKLDFCIFNQADLKSFVFEYRNQEEAIKDHYFIEQILLDNTNN